MQRDSISYSSGLNLYEYAKSNPVMYIDVNEMEWIYSQSSGDLSYRDSEGNITHIATGYAGRKGKYRNNPEMQGIKDKGPLPSGVYDIQPQRKGKNTGPISMDLKPRSGNKMFGRDQFLIHGDNRTRDASQGCIILPRNIRKRIDRSNDKELVVTK